VVVTTIVLGAVAFLVLGIAVSVVAFLVILIRGLPSWRCWGRFCNRGKGDPAIPARRAPTAATASAAPWWQDHWIRPL
jgi:hypothetical protein